MKKAKFAAAVLTALGLILPAFLPQTVSAEVTDEPEKDPIVVLKPETLPTWIPKDFDAALGFLNSYGTTHMEEDYLCIVFEEEKGLELASAADSSMYTVECNSTALDKVYSDRFSNQDENGCSTMQLGIAVFRAVSEGTAKITLRNTLLDLSQLTRNSSSISIKNEDAITTSYEFSIDKALNITETDIYGWLPDCADEYKDFTDCSGEVTTHDGYMIFCLSSNAGTPYEWKAAENTRSWKNLEPVFTQDCSPVHAIPLEGGIINKIVLYQGYEGTSFRIEWNYSCITDNTIEKTLVGDFHVIDRKSRVLLPGEALLEIYNAETGALFDMNDLDMPAGVPPYFEFITQASISDPEKDSSATNTTSINMESNQMLDHQFGSYLSADNVTFTLDCIDTRYRHLEDTKLSRFENGSYRVRFYVHYVPDGDVNNDSILSIADAVAVQKWIIGGENISADDWRSADYNNDKKLDARDLTLMLRKLCERGADFATLHLTASYGGRGVAGQFLAEGYETHKLTAHQGDCFFEYNSGKWAQNLPVNEAVPFIKIKEITDEGVLLEIAKHAAEQDGEILLPYNEKMELFTRQPICDGTNYSYTFWFETSRRNYFENDHTEP